MILRILKKELERRKMKFKRIVAMASVLIVSVVGSVNATYSVDWQTPYPNAVYGPEGSGWLASYDGLWTAVLYISDNNELPAAVASSFDFSTWNVAPSYSDQSMVATAPVQDFGDDFGSVSATLPTVNVNSNQYFYTVVWNGTTPGSADHFVILENGTPFDVPFVDVPPATQGFTYVTGGSAPDGSDWVAVPEPTTLALFGIGLIGMLVRRVSKR